MKVRIIKYTEEISEMPDKMFKTNTDDVSIMKYISKYSLKDEYIDCFEDSNVICIQDMNGNTIAEF